jgi:hypothetical protein
MEELGYSPGSAWRRIKAMRALQELPELEEKIEQGALTLANVSQVQSFCEKEAKTLKEKKQILDQVAGLSKRETERLLARIAPMPERPEKVRALGQEATELRVTLSSETLGDLDKIRDLISHAHPGASYAEVIAYLAKLGLKKLDPAEKSKAFTFPAPGEQPSANRAVPSGLRRAVWLRDQGRCSYINPETGKTCGSTAFLQLDHVLPRAKGGQHTLSNLRLRCQSHNLLAAVAEFGEAKMAHCLKSG